MGISKPNFPDGQPISYLGGDIDYIPNTDSVDYTNANRPIHNLAERDVQLRDALNNAIDELNNAFEGSTLTGTSESGHATPQASLELLLSQEHNADGTHKGGTIHAPVVLDPGSPELSLLNTPSAQTLGIKKGSTSGTVTAGDDVRLHSADPTDAATADHDGRYVPRKSFSPDGSRDLGYNPAAADADYVGTPDNPADAIDNVSNNIKARVVEKKAHQPQGAQDVGYQPSGSQSIPGTVDNVKDALDSLDQDVQTLKTTAFVEPPVGTILPWHKNFPSTPSLPPNWIECNGQTINEPLSPYNGQTAPNLNNPASAWNANGVFIRGGLSSSDAPVDDTFQGHAHPLENQVQGHVNLNTLGQADGAGSRTYLVVDPGTAFQDLNLAPTDNGTNGVPRAGNETAPSHVVMVWIMRIY